MTYNPDLPHLLKFCRELSAQFMEVLFIDNNSANKNEFSELTSLFSNVKIIFNEENIGLATAQNLGVRYAFDMQVPGIVIFDQDSFIEHRFLETMVNDFNTLVADGNNVACIGPSIIDKQSGHRYPISRYRGFFLKRYVLQPDEIAECSYIISSGSLTSIVALKDVGFFLDKLFINYIDVEWCFRAISKKYKVYTTNNVSLIQDVGLYRKSILGREIPVHNPIRRYYASRNSVIMLFLDHVSWGYKLREIVFNPIRVVFDCMIEGNTWLRLNYFFKGLYDGFKA